MNAAQGQDGPIARLRPGGADRRRPGRQRRPALRRSSDDGAVPRLSEWHRMSRLLVGVPGQTWWTGSCGCTTAMNCRSRNGCRLAGPSIRG